jgi:hypothetical protein
MPDEGKLPENKPKVPFFGIREDDRKVGLLERYLNRFFNRKAMEPLVKGFLLDLLIGGISRMINGTSTPSGGYGGTFQSMRQDYGRMFQNNLIQNQQHFPSSSGEEFAPNEFPVADRVSAIEFIEWINNKIRCEGKIRITDANEVVKKPDRDWVDRDYGWYDITGYQIVPRTFGRSVIVVLPTPVKLKN